MKKKFRTSVKKVIAVNHGIVRDDDEESVTHERANSSLMDSKLTLPEMISDHRSHLNSIERLPEVVIEEVSSQNESR